MYTQCPHCQTIFGVSEAHLSAAFGRVRCGHCRGQFNAKRHLLEALPTEANPTEPPLSPLADQHPPINSTAEIDKSETENVLAGIIPADEIDHIDLSAPAGEPSVERIRPDDEAFSESVTTAEEADIALPNPVTEPVMELIEVDDPLTINEITDTKPLSNETALSLEPVLPATDDTADIDTGTAEPTIDSIDQTDAETTPAPPKKLAEDQELDDIFAALDNRLEALSEESDASILKPFEKFESDSSASTNYEDAFGDPDNQTADDIQADIESIFAAAEAELSKSDKADEDEINYGEEVPLDVFLTEADEPTQNSDDELVFLDIDTNEPLPDQSPESSQNEIDQPAFMQEELPFALHEELSALEPSAPRSKLKSFALFNLIVLLLLAIGFQLALFRNVEIANKLPISKPYLVMFCEYLPCQFSGQRDIKRIHLTSRDVRSQPQGKNTVLISAIFVNNAHFDQPFPDILITLSDLTSTVVAQRRFTPQDYLAKSDTFQLMKARKPVHITLEVLDPGNDAVNFQFEFL